MLRLLNLMGHRSSVHRGLLRGLLRRDVSVVVALVHVLHLHTCSVQLLLHVLVRCVGEGVCQRGVCHMV